MHEFYRDVMEGNCRVDTAAKCWLLKPLKTPMLMGSINVSQANAGYLIIKANDPFLDGVLVKIVTKQGSPGEHQHTMFIGAIREVCAMNPLFKHAIHVVRRKVVASIDDITECQFYTVLKNCLHYAGCDLVRDKKKTSSL
jgi:hypothetical protein